MLSYLGFQLGSKMTTLFAAVMFSLVHSLACSVALIFGHGEGD